MKHLSTLLLLSITLFATAQSNTLALFPAHSDTLTSWRFYAEIADEGLISLSFAPHGYRPQLLDGQSDHKSYRSQINWQGQEHAIELKIDSSTQRYTVLLNGELSLGLQSPGESGYTALGSQLKPSVVDLRILDRTQQLLGAGNAWNQDCEGFCEEAGFPFSWSLSCALQQASMDVSGRYLPHRPALEAVLEASSQYGGFKDLHDFNRQSSFEQIDAALLEARRLITDLIMNGARRFDDRSRAPGLQKLESRDGSKMNGSVGQ